MPVQGVAAADSGDVVGQKMYSAASAYLGKNPVIWGRYFYTSLQNGSGYPFYDPSIENEFFYNQNLRLLPITDVKMQGANLTNGDYTTGYNDAQNNLLAVLDALGDDATLFPCIIPSGETSCTHWTAFALDCEDDSGPVTVNVAYLHGWLVGMKNGVTDRNGVYLYGWSGIYNAIANCGTWSSVVTCSETFGISPHFIWTAGYPYSSPLEIPPWNTDDDCNTEETCGIALGQATVLWQYYGDATVSGSSSLIDLDQGNPNIDVNTALTNYCPAPIPL
ncbi:MAG: hypothetical protein OWR62_12025 [Sulfobacillus thermotolerans]|nr:hypothetical protein [Sulfobacillus thermotolerans]